MMKDKKQKISNTIEAIYNVLEKNKDNEKIKDAYTDAKKLIERTTSNKNY